jgi:hypothetical protein
MKQWNPFVAAFVLSFGWLTAPVAAQLTTDLQGYWQFNGDGLDASGNGRDLTLQGGVGFGGGLFGSALDLPNDPGMFAQRTVNDTVFDFGGGDFAVQVWVNYNGTSGEQVLIEKIFGGGGPGWTLTKLADDVYRLHAFGALALDSSAQTITTGEWHHVVARRSGTSFEMFFDNTLVASDSSGGSITVTTNGLLIGQRTGGGFPMDGRLDEIAIWTRALTDPEITALYNGGSGLAFLDAPAPTWIPTVYPTNARSSTSIRPRPGSTTDQAGQMPTPTFNRRSLSPHQATRSGWPTARTSPPRAQTAPRLFNSKKTSVYTAGSKVGIRAAIPVVRRCVPKETPTRKPTERCSAATLERRETTRTTATML